ncbi:MAG: hypothetical protein L0Y72_17400 [Gemmataceae bacterium]|nr:hypothetical protein [Gemmataceae bacterium]MCI0740829.1 hypothetical protein [Gemmataceae bacterium]
MSRRVAALFGCSVWAAIVALLTAAPAGEPKMPKPLPQTLRDAWQKAGFTSGWMDRRIHFFPDSNEGPTGEVPFFQVREWKAGEVAKLTQPERPFGLDLSYAEVTDAVLEEIAGLKKLHSLQLVGGKVIVTGLKHLGSLENLQSLTIIGGTLTDLGTKHLAELKTLRELALIETEVTETSLGRLKNVQTLRLITPVKEAGLRQLAELENFKELAVWIDKATETELNQLARFKYLRKLDVSAWMTDAGLTHLTLLKNLRSLGLASSKVTDAGLKLWTDLQDLEELDLSFTWITDDGLKHVAKLKNLRLLVLAERADFSDASVAELKNALPMLKITRVARRHVE